MNENGSAVEAFEMPSQVNDYAQNLSPEMVAQAHQQAANYLPAEAH